MPVMPLAHRPLYPGERPASDAEELKARGEHPLVASGSCGLLHLLLPALISPSSATTGPATCEVPFRLAGWLSLPLLRLAEGVEGTLFYLSMVGPERMGAAIDAAMAKAGLSEATAEPVDPAVLRLRLLRAATALHSDAAGGCFDVRPSDMYSLGEPSEGEDAYTPLVTRAEEDRFEPGGPNAGSSRAGLHADSLLDAPVPEGLVAPLTPLAPALMDAPVPDALEAPILPVSLDACAAPTERAADVRAATAISLLWAACASADAGATCLVGRTTGAADAACLWQHRRRGSRGGRRAPSRRLTTFS